MTKVLPGQITVVRAEASRGVIELPHRPPESVSVREGDSAKSVGGQRVDEDLQLALLELLQRAPAPAVGPSHWWG